MKLFLRILLVYILIFSPEYKEFSMDGQDYGEQFAHVRGN